MGVLHIDSVCNLYKIALGHLRFPSNIEEMDTLLAIIDQSKLFKAINGLAGIYTEEEGDKVVKIINDSSPMCKLFNLLSQRSAKKESNSDFVPRTEIEKKFVDFCFDNVATQKDVAANLSKLRLEDLYPEDIVRVYRDEEKKLGDWKNYHIHAKFDDDSENMDLLTSLGHKPRL